MSSPRYPDSWRAGIYDLVVDRLKSDDLLRRLVKTWKVGRSPDDALETTADRCDAVTLIPLSEQSARVTPHAHRSPMTIVVKTEVIGHDHRRSMALWDLIESRLWPQDPDERAAWEAAQAAAGVAALHCPRPAYGSADPKSLARGIITSPDGQVLVEFYAAT